MEERIIFLNKTFFNKSVFRGGGALELYNYPLDRVNYMISKVFWALTGDEPPWTENRFKPPPKKKNS